MKAVFRADASLQIGTGHVMRCLTLADALAERGAVCHFICREHPGHLIEFIRSKGHAVHALPMGTATEADAASDTASPPAHAPWLGATQAQDAAACATLLIDLQADWLIVDHYALDARWESLLKPHCRSLMVIDDLADRAHVCDLLLDQTLGRQAEAYRPWVPVHCRLLCGSHYALLRPEFAALRAYSLKRREVPQLRQLLITMGGVDKDNATWQVLEALRTCSLPVDCQITVVMGPQAPWLEAVREQAQDLPWPTRVLAGVSNMAQLMADSDLAIGAAGATSWERCCLGLPSIMLVLAANQRQVAQSLALAGAVKVLQHPHEIPHRLRVLLDGFAASPSAQAGMSATAARITDGSGASTVVHHLESLQ